MHDVKKDRKSRPRSPSRAPIPWTSKRLTKVLLEKLRTNATAWGNAAMYATNRSDIATILAVAQVLHATHEAVQQNCISAIEKMAAAAPADFRRRAIFLEDDRWQISGVAKIMGDYFQAYRRQQMTSEDIANTFLAHLALPMMPWSHKLGARKLMRVGGALGGLERFPRSTVLQTRRAFASTLATMSKKDPPPDSENAGEVLVRKGLSAVGWTGARSALDFISKRAKRAG
jgi:hypothetical protein